MTLHSSWREAFSVYLKPKVLGMFFLGFAAGLPFPLVFTTLSTWLRDVGVERATIGFFAWIGITYSIKIFWAPVVDRAPLFMLTRLLGQRRGWMLLAQAGIIAGYTGWMGGGVAIEDFDNDGDFDVVVAGGPGQPNRLFIGGKSMGGRYATMIADELQVVPL